MADRTDTVPPSIALYSSIMLFASMVIITILSIVIIPEPKPEPTQVEWVVNLDVPFLNLQITRNKNNE